MGLIDSREKTDNFNTLLWNVIFGIVILSLLIAWIFKEIPTEDLLKVIGVFMPFLAGLGIGLSIKARRGNG